MYRIEVPIPICYLKLSEGSDKRGELFKSYVNGYIKRSYPDMELVKNRGHESHFGEGK